MPNKKEWHDFYTQPVNLPEFIRVITSHKVYLSALINLVQPQDRILEVGCGTSVDSIYLSHLGYKTTAIDNNEKILELAKRNNEYFRGSVQYRLADMFDLRFNDKEFKVCFSQGILSFFSAAQIKKTIAQQLRVADFVLFSVPSIYFDGCQSFGGTNLWSFKEWLAMIKDFKLIDYNGYSFTRSGRLINRINKIIFKNKLKKPVNKFFALNLYFIVTHL